MAHHVKRLSSWTLVLTLGIMMVALASFYLTPGETRSLSSPTDIALETIIIETEPIISGFNVLSDLKMADDGRFFVAQKGGLVRIGKSDGTIIKDPFLDLTGQVGSDGELGLASIALHPQFSSNGRFFVNYTTAELETRVVSYNVSTSDANIADPLSAQTILTVNQTANNHNGAGMAFGPDGYLYVGLGDGGPGNDPYNHAQDGQSLLGSILRLDVDGAAPYEIPDDNPFKLNPAVKNEIWAMGLRNPWRFTFDRSTGDLFIGDVGQRTWEEIDFEPAGDGGKNYGWRCYEGPKAHITDGCGDASLYEPPIYSMLNPGVCAIVGGYVYRGNVSLPIDGHYLFADFCSGNIWSMVKAADKWELKATGTTQWGGITTFGEGPNGELYVASFGTIHKISARSIQLSPEALLPIVIDP